MTTPVPDIPVLTDDELAIVTERQRAQQAAWRDAADHGQTIDIAGMPILVLPRVFAPGDDTRFMLRHLQMPPGARVLDVGTGSGVLATVACARGATLCVAVDINPDALANAQRNCDVFGFQDRMEVRASDGLNGLAANEVFDVILANLPGRSGEPQDDIARAQWDAGFQTNRRFFEDVPAHMAPGATIFMTKANYPELPELLTYAGKLGFSVRIVDRMDMPGNDPRVYYLLSFSWPLELGSA